MLPSFLLTQRTTGGRHEALGRLASGPDRVPGRRAARTRLDLARRRAGTTTLLPRGRSLCRRTAPRNRHRRGNQRAGALPDRRRRQLRGHGPGWRARRHCRDSRRLLSHPRPSRLDRCRASSPDRGGRGSRLDRPERRSGARRALPASRGPPDGRSARLRRPPDSSPTAPRGSHACSGAGARRDASCAAGTVSQGALCGSAESGNAASASGGASPSPTCRRACGGHAGAGRSDARFPGRRKRPDRRDTPAPDRERPGLGRDRAGAARQSESAPADVRRPGRSARGGPDIAPRHDGCVASCPHRARRRRRPRCGDVPGSGGGASASSSPGRRGTSDTRRGPCARPGSESSHRRHTRYAVC